MTLPTTNISALNWGSYQGNPNNLIAQYSIDFTSYSAVTYSASGRNPNANVSGSGSDVAGGLCIDNLYNMNSCQVQVGNGFVENIPPYSKTIVQLGGTAPYVKISSAGGQVLATFYTGNYPGSLGQQNLLAANTQAIAVYLPSGMMMQYGGLSGNIPDGWLYCNGQTVSRTAYAPLFAAIGTLYGAGDGTSTFQLPDLRGKFLRGYDDAVGVDPGRALGSTQALQVGSHVHRIPFTFNNGAIYTSGDGSGFPAYGTLTTGSYTPYTVADAVGSFNVTNVAATNSATERGTGGTPETVATKDNRPPNVTTLFIIKT